MTSRCKRIDSKEKTRLIMKHICSLNKQISSLGKIVPIFILQVDAFILQVDGFKGSQPWLSLQTVLRNLLANRTIFLQPLKNAESQRNLGSRSTEHKACLVHCQGISSYIAYILCLLCLCSRNTWCILCGCLEFAGKALEH